MKPLINRDRLLDRFLQYVQIDTAANPHSDRYPSSVNQLRLGEQLLEQLRKMGVEHSEQDTNGLVWATLPATDGGGSPTVALIAHLDTSPEAPSDKIQPQVIRHYDGGDITLANGQQITPVTTPELNNLIGCTLITTDGSTLLGGDDKAGVAIIMELAEHLMEHPRLPHGKLQILFTCDEEIGRGTDKVDLAKLDAHVGYTLDGGGAGLLDVGTFSADAVSIVLLGRNIHPSIAKGRMINAIRAAAWLIDRLPVEHLPETTTGRAGFLHPHHLQGSVGEANLELILRSFETAELDRYYRIVHDLTLEAQNRFPGLQVKIDRCRQYRNLADGLREVPEVIEFAEQAFENLGRSCQRTIVRGGTDGSQLTEKGLPTPNLSSGQHNIHATTEFACLDQMSAAIEHLIELLRLWSQQAKS